MRESSRLALRVTVLVRSLKLGKGQQGIRVGWVSSQEGVSRLFSLEFRLGES
jgi:hypothetical protein